MSVIAALNRAWRYLGWKHAAAALAAGIVMSLSICAATLHINLYWIPWKFLYLLPWHTAFAAVFIVGVAVVESNAPDERPSLARYFAVAAAASAICIASALVFSDYVKMAPRREVATPVPPSDYSTTRKTSAVFGMGFDGAVHCMIGLFVYVRLRNARLAARALHEAQVHATASANAATIAQLEATRRRIDPAWLIQSLEKIERLYWLDGSRADASLDQLVEFLRAAIPEVRGIERRRHAALQPAE